MLPDSVQRFLDAEIEANTTDFADLRVVYLTGTLKRSPEASHTDGLIDVSRRVFDGVNATVDVIRTVDHVIPPGVYADMREQSWDRDDFPDLYRRYIEPAHIVVLASPIWLGDQSSVTRLIIERLYGWSADLNYVGQWSYYGNVTANRDLSNPDHPNPEYR